MERRWPNVAQLGLAAVAVRPLAGEGVATSDASEFMTLTQASAAYGVGVGVLMLRIKSGRLLSKRAGNGRGKHLVRPEDVRAAIAWATCDAVGCDSQARARSGGLCIKHSARMLRHGTLTLPPRPSGAAVANWAGDGIKYKSAHHRVVRAKGKASQHPCELCNGPAQDWAYNHEDPTPLTAPDGRLYSSKPEFYIPLCKTCHRRLDVSKRTEAGGWKTHCKNGHEFTPENTRNQARGGRACRACSREAQREAQRQRAQRATCNRGHAMTEDNTIHGRDGRRMCRTCHRNAIEARGIAS